ncbi:type II toxin-antitoxin system RelE/ParE family toxin [Jiella sp. M17.18]|uniref:type II toxin-antitoxin system RelE family toxin n=1 Tax=Jiella sp. M17.18 TaxID=3234247 RepID=UPI0034DEC9E3
MAWRIELSEEAERNLQKLDRQTVSRLLRFLHERVARLDDPRALGKPLKGSDLGKFWRYRVGDYRIVAHIADAELLVLVVRIGHRREVYR